VIVPRQGTQIHAWAEFEIVPQFATTREGTVPYLVGWQYGEAYTWCEAGLTRPFHQRYGPDAFFSTLLYSTGRELPMDVVLVHRVKERFHEYSRTKGIIISLVEFVEKFGADTDPLMVKVLGMDESWKEARRQYIRQDYDACWSSFDQLLTDISAFQEDAVALKNNALFWVHLTEWCVITGTSLLAGFVLWSLMVSRRFYRKIDQTRLRPPPGNTGAELPEYSNRESHPPWWRTGKLHRLLAIR
jgi:hypothetical protein